MRVLILNRRDIASPAAGGAEVYTHEIARGLTGKYHCEVVVFSSQFQDSAAEEVIDGVRHLRRGNEATVHLWGFIYTFRNRKKYDFIIDQFNGTGFFTFLLPDSILLIHQMYKEFWFRELGMAGVIPCVLEPLLLKCYRNRLAITVSESTKKDLEVIGFRRIGIVMNAVNVRSSRVVSKDKEPTLVFLGRLRSTKQPKHAIRIFQQVKEHIPAARLWIIGTGPLDGELKSLARDIQGVTFWGFVSEQEKINLLSRAHLLIVPSVREGFGINVIEAASAGTPAIGYDVPGLRDSIRNCETGYLVASAVEAANRITDLLTDSVAFELMSQNCMEYAKGFDWWERVDEFWKIISDTRHPGKLRSK